MVSTNENNEENQNSGRINSIRKEWTDCEIGQTRNLDFERRATSWIIYDDGRVELYNNRSELIADNCPR